MWIQGKHCDTRLDDAEVARKRFVEDAEFFDDGFFCDGLWNFCNGQMGGDKCHAQVIVAENHQRLVAFTDASALIENYPARAVLFSKGKIREVDLKAELA